jgi:hypothetical protein
MSSFLFEKHKPLLAQAVQALATRSYWSPYSEQPSPRVYGESAAADGKQAFDALLGKVFELGQPGQTGVHAGEISPYGAPLNVRYPVCNPQALVDAALAAMPAWGALGAEGRTGILMEALERLNKRSFEISHAVMMTTGQGWMMAFQAGGPHAQDRGLEAVAAAWREQAAIPREVVWEKPQGKNVPLRMQKHFEIVGRGVALVIGCGTFPTWNTYPGVFAALATGNPVIVKPHENAILPAAITVAVIRQVLAENGMDPNLITLAVTPERSATQILATHADVKSVDFTGSNQFGAWLMENCKQAQVYAELAGVNNVVIESTDAYRAMLKNLAFTLSLYSGQMCTTTQAIIVPAGGVDTDEGTRLSTRSRPTWARRSPTLWPTPKSPTPSWAPSSRKTRCGASLNRRTTPKWCCLPASSATPSSPAHRFTRPRCSSAMRAMKKLIWKSASARSVSWCGPRMHQAAIALSERIVQEHGALTAGIYSTRPEVLDAMVQATWRSKVALSINLTSNIFVNQSAGFSDYHGTGGNPSANASYTDSAFVANRFRVVQRRFHI